MHKLPGDWHVIKIANQTGGVHVLHLSLTSLDSSQVS